MAVLRPTGEYDRSYAYDLATIRRLWQWGLLVGFLLALYALPLYANSGIVSLVNRICTTIIALQGLNILTGYAGKISIGQGAFMAVGGYASTLLMSQLGVNFFLALPVAAVSAGLVGLVFGLPSLRVKGLYLLMATLAAQLIIPWFFRNTYPKIFNGTGGLTAPVPALFGFQFNQPGRFLYIALTMLIITTIVAHNVARSRIGRAFVTIRDNDLASEIMGIDLFRYLLQAFFLASVYAGIAGVLMTHTTRQINPASYGLDKSILLLGMLVVGGLGTSLGPILGGIVVEGLLEVATLIGPLFVHLFPHAGVSTTQALRPLIFGLVLMFFLIREPRGLAHRWQLFKASWRLRPFSH